eukprot:jgi/Psemu1/228773/e_gw1.2471.2.1
MLYRSAFLFFFLAADLAKAFSSGGGTAGNHKSSDEPEIVTRNFVEITNLNAIGHKESLPASFIERWPNWFLETDGRLVRIPDEESGGASGFVTAISLEKIYQPVDLKRPEIKLAVGLHIRSGMIRHVLPALDVSYGKGLHRNRGLCSVPLAYNWVDFGFLNSIGDYNSYQIKLLNSGDTGWDELCSLPGSVIAKAIERAIVCLAEEDSDDLGNGSHIIHVALDDAKIFEMPKPKTNLRVTMVETADKGEEDVDVGILEVAIVSTMSGSESEYLPEAYKPLFSDESLRNPLYTKFKKRKGDRAREEEIARKESRQEL